MLEVRPLSADDWELWRSLRLQALAEAPHAFGATLETWQHEPEVRWRERLSLPGGQDFVVFSAGLPVGMVSGVRGPTPGSVGLISMWVSPTARGQGVGDLLMATVEAWALTQGAVSVRLSVKVRNQAAIALYERHGYTDAGEPPEPQADGSTCELSMVKELG